MMRVALILTLASVPAFAITQEQSEPVSKPDQVEPKECQSCTARHKSLQALQEALSPPDTQIEEPDDGTGEVAGD